MHVYVIYMHVYFFNWYLKNLIYEDLKICFIEEIKNVSICIAYMQGELNIFSTYRFMLSVSYIEELDNSSLCDTRV